MRLHATLTVAALLLAPALPGLGCGDGQSPAPSPDAVTDSAPDTAPDTATDAAPDATPDDTADAAPDAATDSGADSGMDIGGGDVADGGPDPGPDGGGAFIDNPWGLPITAPGSYTVPCQNPLEPDASTMDVEAMHWLCTFDDGTSTGHVYVEATPTGCAPAGLSTPPEFGLTKGWMAPDGGDGLTPLTSPAYDWGGNHHNDSLSFGWGGKTYRYYHSSLGVGWRKCQPMDCMQIRDAQGTLLEDGCTKERTLPIVCRQVQPDGTWEPLTDTFTPCAGDPNYR